MKEKINGVYILCIGILVLSLELYMVKLIQSMDKVTGSWHGNIWIYFKEPIIFIPFMATICVIIYSIYIIIKTSFYSKN